MIECPDLKALDGDRYLIRTDEGYFAETGSSMNCNTDPWLWQIPCRYGHIYPWGPDLLAAVFEGRRRVSMRLVHRGFPLLQDGDDGQTVGFHPDQFDEVAAEIRPHKKPQFTEEQKQRFRENLGEYSKKGRKLPTSSAENASIAKT